MDVAKAFRNIADNFSFQFQVKGGLSWRLLYLTVYYAAWTLLRWGQRHYRALRLLKRLGLCDRIVDLEMPDGVRLRIDLYTACDILHTIYWGRIYEPTALFEPRPGQVVFDVGGQQGLYTCRTASKLQGKGLVVTFEPHPGNYQILSENVARNRFSNVRLVRAALSGQEGEMDLYVHPFSGWYSLIRESRLGTIRVSCKTLDQAAKELDLGRMDILKIDVEGASLDVLQGGLEVLRRLRPMIVIEIESEKERRGIPALLEKLDYTVHLTDGYLYAYPREADPPPV